MKKVLSLVLVIAMVLSSMSFAFASTFEDVTGDYEKAVDTLSALGVIDGYDDGSFKPEKTITRAEMAKLMVITLGYGDLVAGSKSNFADTQGHWADAYIALAAGKGIVLGDGNGNFRPDATVTYNEVFTMLVRGLGYTDNCNELAGMSWPTNFKVKAAELGITDDVVMNTTGADRGGVAQAIFNALNATLVTVDSEGDVTLVVDRDDEQVELFTRLADLDTDYVVSEENLDPSNKNYGGNLVDLESYMFQSLKVYLNDDDEVVYVKSSNSLVYEGEIDDVVTEGAVGDEITTVSIEDANGKIKKVAFTDATGILDTDTVEYEVFENGVVKGNSIDYKDLKDSETIKIVAMDDEDLLAAADNDGKIDQVEVIGFVTTLRTDVVRIEKEYVDGKDSLDGINLPVDSDDEVDLANLHISGDAEALEDIKLDDIVVVYSSEEDEVVTIVVSRDTVEGKVTKVTDGNTVSIDGTSYDLASMSLVANWALDLGDEGVFYLDQAGEIADYEGSSVGPTDYAVVISSAPGKLDTRFGTSIDTYPELKLATQNNEEVVYEVAIDIDSTAEIEESAKITKLGATTEVDLFTIGTTYAPTAVADALTTEFNSANAYLVKYSLDKDGRIDEIEVLADVTPLETYEAAGNNVDLDKSNDTLSENVVVFDATSGDYEIADAEELPTLFEAFEVRNDNGEIEVLVVEASVISSATDTIFAYLNKVTLTYNEDGDKVSQYVVYVDGEKKEILADDDNKLAVDTYDKAISFKYNGELVDDSTVSTIPTSVAATATAINAKGGMIQLNVAGTKSWYALSEHATILEVEAIDDDTTVTAGNQYSVNEIQDLYDIDENDLLEEVYVNADGDIDLIVIYEK